MDDVKTRLFLYDQHAARLYRLALLLLREKKEAEEVIFDIFIAIQGRGRRVSHVQWGGQLAEQCMKASCARLRASSAGALPLSPLQGGKLGIAMEDLPAGARALSVLTHYAHVEVAVAAQWLGMSESDAVSTLYAIEETLGASPNELSATWRSHVVLYRPPIWLRERIREHKTAEKRSPVPIWVAGAAAAFMLAFLFINPQINAGYRPKPTPTPTPAISVTSEPPEPTASPDASDAPAN